MTEYSIHAVNSASSGLMTFCKFLAANDTGETGGHQSGIYMSKPAVPILFDEPGIKGDNKEKWVRITWQNGELSTDSRFIYYGKGTRNEYRITNFGRGFPFLSSEYTGALFVLVKKEEFEYEGFILNTENEIENFLDSFGITPPETNRLINTDFIVEEQYTEEMAIDELIATLQVDFPASEVMSTEARNIWLKTGAKNTRIRENPDACLLEWTEMEFRLFRELEHNRYGKMIQRGFDNVEDFISLANKVLNRRKSRAGRSLEHHIAAILDANEISYTAQGTTEGNKRPDFIFPSEEAYHDPLFSIEYLTTLAAKTTCKDRWRQVINEADRLRDQKKYLCTLQQGISEAQMDEMETEGVILVVPKPYISTYPKSRQEKIWTMRMFIEHVKDKEMRHGR